MPNKIILIFIDWFLPGYKAGGPIQSVANLVNQFKTEFDISIVTSNHDLGEKTSYPGIALNEWIGMDGYRIIYLDKVHENIKFYRQLFSQTSFDILYCNSFFSIPYTLKPILIARSYVKQIVLAPRGMLGTGALQIKWFKKKGFIALAKSLRFYNNITWHATAESEKEEIKKIFGQKAKVKLAPNLLSERQLNNTKRSKQRGEVNLFFVSRIAQKKNLLEAIKMLALTSAQFQIKYTIIGPIDEPQYWEKCKNEIANLPAHVVIDYIGAINNKELTELLSKYHFLLLPTLHENYGHVIMESLQCGCPVIISDRTPWRNLQNIEFKPIDAAPTSTIKVGWDLPLENHKLWIETIEKSAVMNQAEYDEMSNNAFNYAQSIVNNKEIREANRKLFN